MSIAGSGVGGRTSNGNDGFFEIFVFEIDGAKHGSGGCSFIPVFTTRGSGQFLASPFE